MTVTEKLTQQINRRVREGKADRWFDALRRVMAMNAAPGSMIGSKYKEALHPRLHGKWRAKSLAQTEGVTSPALPEKSLDTLSEVIALTSPSGSMSKRSREAASERLRVSLFGQHGLAHPTAPQPEEKERLLKQAAELRGYAERGLRPKAHIKRAEELERMAGMIPGSPIATNSVPGVAVGSKFKEFLHPRLKGKWRSKGLVKPSPQPKHTISPGAPGAPIKTSKLGAAPHGQPGHISPRPDVAPGEPTQKRVLAETKVVDGKRVLADGRPLPEHVAKAKIPPAWTDVRVAIDPDADLIAKGVDAKGRVQAVFSEKHWTEAAASKFARTKELLEKFDAIVAQNAKNLGDKAQTENAVVLALIMQTGIRPGSDKDTGAEKKAFGATTLEARHVVVDGDKVRLKFVGKKGVALDIPVDDKDLAGMLRDRASKASRTDKLFGTDNGKLLAYAHSMDGGSFKTKDFRTAVGTRTAIETIATMQAPASAKEYVKRVKDVAKIVARKLGNTPTVALQSYIDPSVFSGWRQVA